VPDVDAVEVPERQDHTCKPGIAPSRMSQNLHRAVQDGRFTIAEPPGGVNGVGQVLPV
jgi:hypothetical protein